jgi:hypothetical protein
MAITFSTAVTLFTNIPVGTWFRREGFQAVYLKTDGWHARRAGSRIEVRIPAGAVCYEEVR